MKRICHLTSVHPATDIRILRKECAALAKAGYEVVLIAVNCETELIDGVQVIGVSCKYNSRLTRILKAPRVVYNKALEIDAEIYHIHDPELLPFAIKLKRKGKKVIYDTHEDVPRQIQGKYYLHPLLRTIISFVFEIYENYISRKLNFIVTATPHIGDRFLKINPNTLVVNNYPKLNELFKEINWEGKSNEICYIGLISQIRGAVTMIDALNYVEDIKLNIGGNYESKELHNKLQLNNSWEKVNDLGFLERGEVAEIMFRSMAGIVLFLPLPNHINAQPNKIFEYMSAGLPVIASDFPLWKEIIEGNNCGICVDPNNSKEIGGAINSLVSDESRARQMGSLGRKAVEEKYNWKFEEEKLLNLYTQI